MNQPHLHTLLVDGVRLEARWVRPVRMRADAPTLVLLHEGLGCVAMWKDWPEQLVQATGCTALLYSRAGYGGSDPVSLPRPIRYMQDEGHHVLPRVLDAAGIDRAVLVGHSDGGSIALVTAGGEHDPRLCGLVLMAAHVFNEPICVAAIEAAKHAYRHGELRDKLCKYHGDNVDIAFWGWNQAWLDPKFLHWNLESYLPAVNVPALVLQGRGDEYGTAAQVEAIAGQIGGPVEVCWLDDCGHSPHRDQPQLTTEAIVKFVEGIGTTMHSRLSVPA